MSTSTGNAPARILHLSDIHFRAGRNWDSDPVLRATHSSGTKASPKQADEPNQGNIGIGRAEGTALGPLAGGRTLDGIETFDCFLSHNSKDSPMVRELAATLRQRGIGVWLDEEQLRPGVPWQPQLEAGIRASRSVAVLVGADGLGPWEDEEQQAALSLAVCDKRPVIPVLLADAPRAPDLPMFLRNRPWVDLRQPADSRDAGGIERLI